MNHSDHYTASQDAARTEGAPRSSMMKVAAASMAGSTLEWYDFTLYNAMAALVFNHLFFHRSALSYGTILAFSTLGLIAAFGCFALFDTRKTGLTVAQLFWPTAHAAMYGVQAVIGAGIGVGIRANNDPVSVDRYLLSCNRESGCQVANGGDPRLLDEKGRMNAWSLPGCTAPASSTDIRPCRTRCRVPRRYLRAKRFGWCSREPATSSKPRCRV